MKMATIEPIAMDRQRAPTQPHPSILEKQNVFVRFWGVRGGIACPGPQTARYGGNTSCVELSLGDRTLIFDGGTGMRLLGNELAKRSSSINADVFFTHFHMDHIGGLPFFAPCYDPDNHLRFWAGTQGSGRTTKQALGAMMTAPLFPVGLEEFKAKIDFRDFRPGDVLQPHNDITVRTASLNHPGGSTGYRVEYRNSSIAYITDTEHRPGELDKNVLALADSVDLMIYDCNYTDEEFPKHIGWGHSTWQQGVRLADMANVGQLALFHHDPKHDDELLDRIGREAAKARPNTVVASELMTLAI